MTHAGDAGSDDDDTGGAGESKSFPARVCPACEGIYVACDLCGCVMSDGPEKRKISRFKAAVWFSRHPEYCDTEREFPAVKPPDSDPKDRK